MRCTNPKGLAQVVKAFDFGGIIIMSKVEFPWVQTTP
jgi:hypothetical protein